MMIAEDGWGFCLLRTARVLSTSNRGTYYAWMVQNADAAWSCRRTDLNISWNG